MNNSLNENGVTLCRDASLSYSKNTDIPADSDKQYQWKSGKTTAELLHRALLQRAKQVKNFWSPDDNQTRARELSGSDTGGQLIVQQLLETCLVQLTNDNPDDEPEGQVGKYQFYFCWLQLGSLLKDKFMLQKAIDGASRLTTDFPQYHICVAHAHTEMASLQLREIQDSDTDVLISSSTLLWCKSIQSSIDSMNAYDQSRMNHDPPGHLQTLFLVNAILEMILVYPEVCSILPESLNISLWSVITNINWRNNWEYRMIEQLLLKLWDIFLEMDSHDAKHRYEQVFRMYASLLNQLERFIISDPENAELYERHGHISMQQIKLVARSHSSFVPGSEVAVIVTRAFHSFQNALLYMPSTDPKYHELQNVLNLFGQSLC